MDPSLWGMERRNGRLWLDGLDLVELAHQHGTPLHVASAARLRAHVNELRSAFSGYPHHVQIHFSYKTNPVAGLLQVLHGEGVGAEVVNGYELWLAQKLGVAPDQIVVNGPNKTDEELDAAVHAGVGLLVLDSLPEVDRVARAAERAGRSVNVGLRVCPDVVPKGMNASSVTGSRRNQFGMELQGEVTAAIERVVRSPRLVLRGAMAHIGSGIHHVEAFSREVERLLDVQAAMVQAGARPDVLDIGGGLGTRLSREFTMFEMLSYLGFGRLPKEISPAPADLVRRYAELVSNTIVQGCRRRNLAVPTLILEPGRALVSDAQVLLLSVGAVRERAGIGTFAITDGGAMTVSMMFLSELHAVFLASRDPAGEDSRPTGVFGRLPSPMDVVYRNLPLPKLREGDTLAVMDAGAYFTSTATNFGGGRPAVVLIDKGAAKVVQRAETFADLAAREVVLQGSEPR